MRHLRARITRNNPALIVMMLDMSGSMEEEIEYEGGLSRKSTILAQIINSFVDELVFKCRRGASYHNYFDIAIYGYCDNEVFSLLDYVGCGREIFTINDLVSSNVRKSSMPISRVGANDRYHTKIVKITHWVEEQSRGNTPTLKALTYSYKVVKDWLSRNNNLIIGGSTSSISNAMLVHITDGEATDSDGSSITKIADKIKSLSTGRANVTIFNLHIASSVKEPLIFPESDSEINVENKFAKLLYDTASTLSDQVGQTLKDIYNDADYEGYGEVKAVAYNVPINDLLRILSIGTSTML